jgi:predicted ArsR family transcriptional regulator
VTPDSKLSAIVTGTRRVLLEHLLASDANAVTLADQLEINISAVRSHLDVLEIAGLVSSRLEHARRGRPKRIYFLTPEAKSLFPQQTGPVITALIQAISRSLDVKTTNSLIRQLVDNLWKQILPEKPSGSLTHRIDIVVKGLNDFGFYSSLETTEKQYTIVIRNDVFREALEGFPAELANRFQQEFWNRLSRILGRVPVLQKKSLVPGDHSIRIVIEERRE